VTSAHLDPTESAGAALFRRGIDGEIIMLNLLRFRAVADYSETPELAPAEPISGREAYRLYIDLTRPILRETGGDLVFLGEGGPWFIGPESERWDVAMMVRQNSLHDFFAFASHPEYQHIIGHRTAALEDSRLLPLVDLGDGL
jgi:hypothetical protein